jgi:iron complex outermembrane receptor protein
MPYGQPIRALTSTLEAILSLLEGSKGRHVRGAGSWLRSGKADAASSASAPRKRQGQGVRSFLVLSALLAVPALADPVDIKLQAQSLSSALREFARQTGIQIAIQSELTGGKIAPALNGKYEPIDALAMLLNGTGLTAYRVNANTYGIREDNSTTNKDDKVHTTSHDTDSGAARPAPGGSTSQAAEPSSPGMSAPASKEAQEHTSALEEIVITGTHLRGITKSASPMLRFSREDLERSGYATLDQFIQSVPQNFGGGASQDSVGTDGSVGNDGYGSSINLRGLGPGTSLVLLNGHRLAPGGNSGEFVDISMIPLAAIERVEILTDGASAIYGSDAVGGVVNFILRDNYEGAQTAVRYGGVTDGRLTEQQVSQSFGSNWRTGGALLAYEYYHRDALQAQDRSFASEFTSQLPRTLLPEQKRNSLYANIHQNVGDRMSLYGDLLYSRRDSDNRLAYLSVQVDEQSRNEQIQSSLASRIDLNDDWKAQLSETYSRYRLSGSRLEDTTDNGDTTTIKHVDTDVWSFDAQADGALAKLPGGDLRLAVGGGYRIENVLPELGYALPERHVRVGFGELFVPLVGAGNRFRGAEALDLSVAARYEAYNDYGSDVTPKFGLRWEPIAGLSLRATYGRSFKAPSLVQLASGTESLVAFIPSDFNISITGDPVILLRTQAAHPALRAEKSSSWTAGFDFQPDPAGFSGSLSYYTIHFKDRIDVPTEAGFAEFFNSPQAFNSFMVFNPSAAFVNARLAASTDFLDLTGGAFRPDAVGIWADDALTNIASETQSGVDFALREPLETRAGRFELSLNGTYITNFSKKAAPATPAFDSLNRLYDPLELRMRGGITWSRANLSAVLFANYQNSYRNVDPNSTRIASWLTFDAQVRYDFGPLATSPALQGLSLTASAQNILNRDPPFVADQGSPIANPGYDPTNASPLGRFLALQVAKAW